MAPFPLDSAPTLLSSHFAHQFLTIFREARFVRIYKWWTGALLAVAVVGCSGDKLKRQPVAGTAKYNSKDIQFGSVRFEPAEGQATTASADIREGRFSVPREAGLSPGKYKVWAQAFDRIREVKPGTAPGAEGPPPRDILPPKYQRQPAAELTVQPASDSQPNALTLDLK